MALILALVLSFVLMALALAAASRGIMARGDAALYEESESAEAAARGCAALAKLAEAKGLTQTGAAFGGASCIARKTNGAWIATATSGAATAFITR
jgi:hypothetical protein